MLISRIKNSSQGNLDYEKKKDKYFTGNIELFSNSIRIYKEFNKWSLNELSVNHEVVVNKLLEHYKQ